MVLGKFSSFFLSSIQKASTLFKLTGLTAHTAKSLEIPNHVILLFQPSHYPEVNPIERVWQYVKDMLSWELFASLTGQDSLLISLSVAGN